ncbi:tyrosine-type recombinase/integrase [Bradyrhizobium sp. HKCCYLRH2015]|uniref:tyrosine-type recombinase/integrase n=1 Tax=Bradyrhizobium sp. HKCCYLRH2015 TaxID=3420742 RepID=UPI003EB925AA
MSKQPKAPKGCYWREDVLWGRIQTGGRDYRWSLRTDNPKVAAERRKIERARVVASQRYGDHRRTFADALEAWGRFVADKVSPKTLTRYLSSLAVLQPHLEGMYLDEIDKKLIGGIVEARKNTPYVPRGKKHPIRVKVATIKRDLTALSSVFDFCVDEEWIQANPAMDWLKPGHRKKSRLQERRDPIVLPDPAHIEMVIAKAPGLFAQMIRTALNTGARLDELAKGQRRHFDRDRRQLTVIGKRNKLRVIDLEDAGQDLGFRLLSNLPVSLETKALFWHRPPPGKRQDGEPAARPYSQVSSNFRRIVSATAKQAREQAQDFRPFRFHDLRHVHAVNWLKSGRSIYVLQQRLGHTSVKTTEMYLAYLTAEEKHRVMFGTVTTGTNSGTETAVESA